MKIKRVVVVVVGDMDVILGGTILSAPIKRRNTDIQEKIEYSGYFESRRLNHNS